MPSDLENLEAKREFLLTFTETTLNTATWIDLTIGKVTDILAVQRLAEDTGIDLKELEYKIDEVRNCVNSLESAIYELVEPFEDRKRDLDNEIYELEEELEADA